MSARTLSSRKAEGNFLTIGGVNEETGEKNPTSLEGFYGGSRTITTSNGEATVHDFRTSKGVETVWGKSDLNNKLSDENVGEFVTIKYQGKEATKFGKKYIYAVTADAENVMSLPTGETNSTGGNGGLMDAGFDDAEEVAPTPSKNNKARVDALLAKGNK